MMISGCASPNLYSTPRTTPEGDVSHALALEGFGGSHTYRDMHGIERTATVFVPTLPTYQLRYGVSDDIDVGVRLANMTSLATDLKLNPVRSRRFDLAIAPGAQWISVSANDVSVHTFYFHAPLLLGLNVSEEVSLVASPGATYALVTGALSGKGDVRASDGVFARFGLGINVRAGRAFAIHPEVTVMRAFTAESPLIYAFGLGFQFGRLPIFGEGGEQDRGSAGDEWLRPSKAPAHGEEAPR